MAEIRVFSHSNLVVKVTIKEMIQINKILQTSIITLVTHEQYLVTVKQVVLYEEIPSIPIGMDI